MAKFDPSSVGMGDDYEPGTGRPYVVTASDAGGVIGWADVSVLKKSIRVRWIETVADRRRRGVASAILSFVKNKWPGRELETTGFDPEGGGEDFWESFQRKPNGLRSHIEPAVRVLFRMEKNRYTGDEDALAVFPDLDADDRGNVTCYARIGQHSGCDLGYVFDETREATPAEYASLKRELERDIGYNLKVIDEDEYYDSDRLPNGLRSSFGPLHDASKKVRWNVLTPNDSWTHVFLSRNPTAAEVATALWLNPRAAWKLTRDNDVDDHRTLWMSNGDLYVLNRVW